MRSSDLSVKPSPQAVEVRVVRHLYAFACVAAATIACQSSPPPRPLASPVASASAPSSQPDARPPPPDSLASIRARGTLHGDPIKIPAAGKYADRWLVFLGTPDVARAAWVVTPGAEDAGAVELVPVESWPSGVKVVGSVVRQSVVYLVIETVKLLDQPAGLRAVWFDGFGNTAPFTNDAAFAGVRDVAELEKRVDAGPQPAARAPDGALMAVMKAAAKSEAALASIIAAPGVDVNDVWQDAFVQSLETVDAQRLSSSSRAQELIDALKDAIADDRCFDDACEAETPKGQVTLKFAEQSGKWLLRAFAREVLPVPTAPNVAPKAIASNATTTSTEDVLREHVRTTTQVLGEAPLSANGGTIGVAITDLEHQGPAVVVRDGDFARVFPLSSMGFMDANATETRFEARFADVDGDGRTDAIVRGAGRAIDGTPLVFAQAFLAPPPSVNASDLAGDHGSELALLNPASMDAAVSAALSVPARGVAVSDACKLLSGADKLATFRKIATADVRVLAFEEPTLPTYRARITIESKLRQEDVKDTGKRCKDMECSATRPYCIYTDGPYSEVYWFAWDKSTMRLAGAAFYSGT
jgi:hypothetical protein